MNVHEDLVEADLPDISSGDLFKDAIRHERTFLTLLQTSVDQRFVMPYRPTFGDDNQFIDDYHESLTGRTAKTGMVDLGIDGWLLPADAQKLYELAFHCSGDIFELGTYRGLSASIMARACLAAGRDNVIVSVDLDEVAISATPNNLKGRPGTERVHLFRQEGAAAVLSQAEAKRSYAFAFIDHSHSYDHVLSACQPMHRVIDLGGFALFHDFNDPRNSAKDATDYGVYQGVMDGLHPQRWQFWGIYGCTGLFRRVGPV